MAHSRTKEEIEQAIVDLFQSKIYSGLTSLDRSAQGTLADAHKRLQERYAHMGIHPNRYFPADFVEADPQGSYAIPFPPRCAWRTLSSKAELLAHGSNALILAPLYWQTEPIAWEALHPLGLPVSVMHNDNIPVAAEIAQQTGSRLLVVDASIAERALAHFDERGVARSLSAIIAFSPLRAYDGKPLAHPSSLIFRELHLTPGCPLFYQEPTDVGTDRFVANADFLIETEADGTCLVTALVPHVLPIMRYKIPARVHESDGRYMISAS